MLSWCSVTCEWLASWYHLNGQFRVTYTTFRRWLDWCNTNKQSILLKTQSILSLWKQTYIHTFKNLNVYSNYYALAVCFLIDTTWIESQIIIQVVVQIFIFKLVKIFKHSSFIMICDIHRRSQPGWTMSILSSESGRKKTVLPRYHCWNNFKQITDIRG